METKEGDCNIKLPMDSQNKEKYVYQNCIDECKLSFRYSSLMANAYKQKKVYFIENLFLNTL